MDDAEHNTMIVREYVEAFNRGDMQMVAKLFRPDAVVQGVLGWGGMDVVLPIWREIHDAFRVHLTIDDILADGNRVAVRYVERGTFLGPFREHQPTGTSFEVVAMEWFEFRDGRISRRWGARDSASQFRQMGLPLT
jgi:steroid delta-isomerase-like uncharacterized protein